MADEDLGLPVEEAEPDPVAEQLAELEAQDQDLISKLHALDEEKEAAWNEHIVPIRKARAELHEQRTQLGAKMKALRALRDMSPEERQVMAETFGGGG